MGGAKSQSRTCHMSQPPIPLSAPPRDRQTRSSKGVVPAEPSSRSRLARRSRLHQADPPRRCLGAAVTATSSEISLLTGLHHPEGLERVSMPAAEDALLRDKARLLTRRVRDVAQSMPANCGLVCVERGEHAKQGVDRRREREERGSSPTQSLGPTSTPIELPLVVIKKMGPVELPPASECESPRHRVPSRQRHWAPKIKS